MSVCIVFVICPFSTSVIFASGLEYCVDLPIMNNNCLGCKALRGDFILWSPDLIIRDVRAALRGVRIDLYQYQFRMLSNHSAIQVQHEHSTQTKQICSVYWHEQKGIEEVVSIRFSGDSTIAPVVFNVRSSSTSKLHSGWIERILVNIG